MSFTRLTLSLYLLAVLALQAAAQHTMFPPVRGTREMVGAANNLEVEAGFRILEQGGNAVDAGVAATLAAAVTEQSRFGLGGEMPLLVKMAGKPVVAISGIGVAPAKATVDYYAHRQAEPWEEGGRMPPIPAQGIRAAITPGVLCAQPQGPYTRTFHLGILPPAGYTVILVADAGSTTTELARGRFEFQVRGDGSSVVSYL